MEKLRRYLILLRKEGVPFAGGYLDIKFAYHNTPRGRNERRPGSNERGGPIRGSFSQRQNNRAMANNFDPNAYQFNNMTQPNVLNQVAQLATILNAQHSTAPVPTANFQQNQVQQLAYLLQLQQQLNQSQRNPVAPPVPPHVRL